MRVPVKRVAVAVVALGLVGAGGWGARRLGRAQAAGKLPTAPVRSGEFLVVVRCRGDLKARRSVQVSAPANVPELRIVWLAPASSRVKEQEVVLRFDPSSAKRQLQEKEAELKQAQATLEQAQAQARITAEEDRRDLGLAHYQVERARLEASKQEVVSAIQGEESRIELGLAEKKLRVQEATGALHEASDQAKLASLARVHAKAQAEVDLTKERLGKMEVKAPQAGVIVFLSNYSQGWLNAKPFKVGDQVWPGAAVAEIPDLASLEMEGKIEEIDRGRVQVGAGGTVRVDSLPELRLPARLARISPLTQMTWEWPPTSSFRGYGELAQGDARLQPGMNGSLDVVVERLSKALSIPAKGLFTRNGRPVVYVAEKGRYAVYEVKVVARNPDEVAIQGAPAGAQVALVEPGSEPEKKT